MACSTCQNNQSTQPTVYRVFNSLEECGYTTVQIMTWRDLLVCIQQTYTNFNITSQQYNRYLGVIYSITNFNNNPCYFKNSLDEMFPVIMAVINANVC